MKKYIAPALRSVNVELEGSLLIASMAIHNQQSSSSQLTRQRFTDSSNWDGSDDEELVEE